MTPAPALRTWTVRWTVRLTSGRTVQVHAASRRGAIREARRLGYWGRVRNVRPG